MPDFNDKLLFESSVLAWLSGLGGGSFNPCNPQKENSGYDVRMEGQIKFRLILKSLTLASSIHNLVNYIPEKEQETKQIVVWGDQWCTKQDIIKSRLLAQLGRSHRISARLTKVHRLDRPTTSRFLQENHLQSPLLAKYSYGLYLPPQYFQVLPFPEELTASYDPENGLLVAIATFARPRNFPRDHGIHRSFELVRFASLRYHTVVGGLDKLLKYFTKTHAPDDLMTYADLEWSDGQGYRKLGFEAHGDTLPHDFWVDPQTMIRYEPQRLPDGLDAQNAVQMGFIGIKNAGSRKFVKLIHPQPLKP